MRELLTPSVFIIAGIALLACLASFRRDRVIAGCAWTLFAIAYLASTALPVGMIVRAWQVTREPICENPPAGAMVVVLTGGASGAARRSSDVALLHQATFRRLISAIDLASRSAGSHLLVSGGAEVGLVTEAQIARELVLRLGWSAEQLRIEDRSTDTITSAEQVALSLRQWQTKSPVMLVTSALHMRRARFAYRQAGIDAIACSTDYAELPPILPDSLLPSTGALQKTSETWKEILGMAVYAARFTVRRGTRMDLTPPRAPAARPGIPVARVE